MPKSPREFYEDAYNQTGYAPIREAEDHNAYHYLKEFIQQYKISEKRCLEVGSGRGAFQHLVDDYWGVDFALAAGQYIGKNFCVANSVHLPFSDSSFDAIWTIYVLEHVPNPEQCLEELWRVLKPSGYLLLLPAWQCRPWAAQGYSVRPYSDFGWYGKLIKLLIPLRNSVIFRGVSIFPQRLVRLARYLLHNAPTKFHYRELEANFENYWVSDSDAINSMDPFEAYLWYVSRKAICHNYSSLLRGFLIRTGPIILQKSPIEFAE